MALPGPQLLLRFIVNCAVGGLRTQITFIELSSPHLSLKIYSFTVYKPVVLKTTFRRLEPLVHKNPFAAFPFREPGLPELIVYPVAGEMVHTCLPVLVQVEPVPPVGVITDP